MKKIFTALLALSCLTGLVFLCACGSNDTLKGEGSGQNLQIGAGENALTVDEGTIKDLLAAYPQEVIGLKNDLYDYTFKLTADKFKDADAVKAEAFYGDEDACEATYMYTGTQIYLYNTSKKKYLLLTMKGAVDETKAEPATKNVHQITDEEIAEDNNKVLKGRYKGYDLSVVNLPKDISEYNLVVTGTPATAADKKQVYVIKVMEKTGEDTGVRFAVGESGDYYFNVEKNAYVKLK